MVIKGIDQKNFKHRHTKKSVQVKNFSGEEKYYVTIGDFFHEVDLDYEVYESILKELIQKSHITHVKNRFERKETYEYFKKILYTLSIYNFQYKNQIEYLFLYLISDKTIASSIKKYKPAVGIDECLNTYNDHQSLKDRPKDFAKMIEIVFEGNSHKSKIENIHKLYEKEKNFQKNYGKIFEDISKRKLQIYQIVDSDKNKIITLKKAKRLDPIDKRRLSLDDRLAIVDNIKK